MSLVGPVASVTLVCLLALPAAALGQGGMDWEIERFNVEIRIEREGSIRVVETIAADFTRDPHRGILRNIPYRYSRHGARFSLRMDLVSVTDENGEPHPYRAHREDGELRLRIGDPDVYRSERVTYRITYDAERAILHFDEHDELYWNTTGNEWPIPIEQASCRVILPDGLAASATRQTSYVGVYGSTSVGPEPILESNGEILFEAGQRLRPGQGLTIVVGMPAGSVESPRVAQKVGWFLADNGVLIVPLVTPLGLFLLWRRFGRDRGRERAIVVRYDPPERMSPLEVGTLIDERVDTRDITATLIDLAIRGHYRIEVETGPDGELTYLDKAATPPPDELRDYEQRLMKKLFASGDRVELGDLEQKFYTVLPEIKKQVHKALVEKGLADKSLAASRNGWMGLGFLVGIALGVLGFLAARGAPAENWPWPTAAILTAIQLPIAGYFMPRKTIKGRRAVEHIRGLEEYIDRAELEEMDEAARRNRFDTLLPYAMALGLSKRWARKFKDLYDSPPEWYRAHTAGTFTTAAMVTSLNSTADRLGTAVTSTPRSEGGGSSFGSGGSGFSGGFSGGGGGGGGGGGW